MRFAIFSSPVGRSRHPVPISWAEVAPHIGHLPSLSWRGDGVDVNSVSELGWEAEKGGGCLVMGGVAAGRSGRDCLLGVGYLHFRHCGCAYFF